MLRPNRPIMFILTIAAAFLFTGTGCDDRSPLINGAVIDSTKHRVMYDKDIPLFANDFISVDYMNNPLTLRGVVGQLEHRSEGNPERFLKHLEDLLKILDDFKGKEHEDTLAYYFGDHFTFCTFAKEYRLVAYHLAVFVADNLQVGQSFTFRGNRYEPMKLYDGHNGLISQRVRSDWGSEYYPSLNLLNANTRRLRELLLKHRGHEPGYFDEASNREFEERTEALHHAGQKLVEVDTPEEVERYMRIVRDVAPYLHNSVPTIYHLLCHTGTPIEIRRGFLKRMKTTNLELGQRPENWIARDAQNCVK